MTLFDWVVLLLMCMGFSFSIVCYALQAWGKWRMLEMEHDAKLAAGQLRAVARSLIPLVPRPGYVPEEVVWMLRHSAAAALFDAASATDGQFTSDHARCKVCRKPLDVLEADRIDWNPDLPYDQCRACNQRAEDDEREEAAS